MEGSGEDHHKSGRDRVSDSRGVGTSNAWLAGSWGSLVGDGEDLDGMRWWGTGGGSGGAGEISLREWVDRPRRPVDMVECLHIFQQVVEAVSLAHSKGVVVVNVRPSCFVMSSLLHEVSFIESASISAYESSGGTATTSEASCLHSDHEEKIKDVVGGSYGSGFLNNLSSRLKDQNTLIVEFSWYTSPEETDGEPSSLATDVYRLGVLLFELFFMFDTMDEKLQTMSNLRHRVLPPKMLLKWPRVSSFCLWLLHPLPSSRPKPSQILQSDFLNESRSSLQERETALKIRDEIENQEMLLEFLSQLQKRKQEHANNLHEAVRLLNDDIEEVASQMSTMRKKGDSEAKKMDQFLNHPIITECFADLDSRKRFSPVLLNYEDKGNVTVNSEDCREEKHGELNEHLLSRKSRLMVNFEKLEAAYFSMRGRFAEVTDRKFTITSAGKGSTVRSEGSSVNDISFKEGQTAGNSGRRSDWINPFLEGLCKYLSYSKLRVRANLKQGDLLNSSSLICSLGFDRDREFFATAGVNKKIKIFECDVILNEDHDIHYPVVEMISRSKISSICWNSYIKCQIASSDFEGVVQVWDATRSQVIVEMSEHDKRVWSVDFSVTDPKMLASGSDDGAVKLWNINQGRSIGSIRTKANVCSVQFLPDSARLLAIGSADHSVYIYDLRNLRMPCCTLVGHTKTVSYVKFADRRTLVSASTDNSLKLWDLSNSATKVHDNPLQTFSGHTNIKNFVGLSISDGYIATGSETNEVFVYHKAFPMPVLSYKFNGSPSSSSSDPSVHELNDDLQFISCVCWRGQSSTLIAANSTGNIKLLEMV